MKENDMEFVVNAIDKALMNADNATTLKSVKAEVNAFMQQFVLYPEIG